MNELVTRLQERAGLSPEQAQKAADVVAEFLATRVSGDQLRDLAGHIPGLAEHARRIPDDPGEQLGDALRGFLKKRD